VAQLFLSFAFHVSRKSLGVCSLNLITWKRRTFDDIKTAFARRPAFTHWQNTLMSRPLC
jgi:hypothetical protein